MGTPLRVLIVEDSEDDAALLVRELRRGGYDPTLQRVDTAAAMSAALDRETWDIVISDYTMPRFSAPAALAVLQESGLDLPFIIVSGTIGEDPAVAAMKAGAHDYLMKGKLTRLVPAVERELREAEGRRERKRSEVTLEALYRASLQIQEPLELQERLERLFQAAQTVLGLDRLNVLLADPGGRWLEGAASLGTKAPLGVIRVPIGPEGGGLAQAYLTQKAIIWDGQGPVPEELRLKPPYDRIGALRSRAFVIVPLVVQGRAIGVLGADRKDSRLAGGPAALDLLQLFAAQAALAIEHARLYEEQQQAALQLEAKVEDRTRAVQAVNTKLEEASRHKSEFLANMSHELRTPLNSIIGFAEVLRDLGVGPLNAKQARYIGHIHQSGKHLLQLINDILDLAKVEAGKFVLDPESLGVAATLEDILVIARGLAHQKAQTVEAQIAPDLPPLRADSVRFKQILFNLLSNAIKFTPEQGRITLAARRASAAGELLEVRVTDTGIGIKAEDLPRLFQEFVQLEAAATKRHEGTGLGLALTKRLVELHAGRIWAESEGEGRGTTFALVLPFEGPGEPPDTSAGAS